MPARLGAPGRRDCLAGGTAAALTDLGHAPVAVTATRGEAGSPDASPAALAATARTRTAELAAALDILGVREHHWLDYPDGGCADADPEPAADRLAELLDGIRPDSVLTFGPDGFTGHPDHWSVSRWVDLAVARAAVTPRVLHAVTTAEDRLDPGLDSDFGVFELGQPRFCAPEDLALRHVLGPEASRRKIAALRAQASQTEPLIAAVGLERYSAWVSVEAFAEPARD